MRSFMTSTSCSALAARILATIRPEDRVDLAGPDGGQQVPIPGPFLVPLAALVRGEVVVDVDLDHLQAEPFGQPAAVGLLVLDLLAGAVPVLGDAAVDGGARAHGRLLRMCVRLPALS